MGEDFVLSQLYQSKFGVVGMGAEVYRIPSVDHPVIKKN
jgi:hypothetical protein